MYYVINLALNGKHFFATAEHSLRDKEDAERVYKALEERFPASEGYSLDVTHWRTEGTRVSFDTPKLQTLAEMEKENTDGFRNPK